MISVGDKFWFLTTSRYTSPFVVTVTKVGRKWYARPDNSANSSFEWRQKRQQAGKLKLGHTSRKYDGQENARAQSFRREPPHVKTY